MYWALREAIIIEENEESEGISVEDIHTQVQGIANEISILRALRKNITDATNNILAERDKLSQMENNIKWRLTELKILVTVKVVQQRNLKIMRLLMSNSIH